MKISQFLSLLKCEFHGLLGVLAISLIWAFQVRGADELFSIVPSAQEVLFLIIPFVGSNTLFLRGNYGIPFWKGQTVNSLEFLFSRPIRRSALFSAKASIYLGLSLMPLLVICAYSYNKPVIRVELPYKTSEHREATQQFYLTHFEGAFLQKDEKDKEATRYWVVLPKGQVDRARFTLVWVFACTLLAQVIIFALSPARRWVSIPIFVFLLGLTLMGSSSSMKVPSRYEMGLAWVSQHNFLTFLSLGLGTVLAQLYCCRRFVNTEITS
jgi:hypothetical protein